MTDIERLEFLLKHWDVALEAPDAIPKLRKLILSLAMQGKLVPQDPKDQPASELLKEIAAEKKRLVAEGKIKEPKPLPPIKPEEIPYQLPKGWEWVRLGEIAEYNGRPNANPDEIAPETWVLDLEDIEKDSSKILQRKTYAERQSKSTKSTFSDGDILYGKLRPYLNKVVVADRNGVCTTEIVPIVLHKGIDRFFFRTLLKRPSFLKYVNELSYGVKMPRLGTNDAINSIHPLPPTQEQIAIFQKIEELFIICDDLEQQKAFSQAQITSTNRNAINTLLNAPSSSDFRKAWGFISKHFHELYCVKENIEELKKTILQLAVMGKLVPQDPNDQPASELLKEIEAEKRRLVKEGKIKEPKPLPPIRPEEIPYQLPKGWEWVRLGEISSIQTGKKDVNEGNENGQYPFYSCASIPLKSNSFSFDCEALIMPGNGANVGYVFKFRGRFEAYQRTYVVNDILISIDYLEQVIEARFADSIKGKQYGSAINYIKMGTLTDFLIPTPPLKEQNRIVDRIHQLEQLCKQSSYNKIEQQSKLQAIWENSRQPDYAPPRGESRYER